MKLKILILTLQIALIFANKNQQQPASRYPLRDSIGISQGKIYQSDKNSVSRSGVQAGINNQDTYHPQGLKYSEATGDYHMSNQQRNEQDNIRYNRKSTEDNLSPSTINHLSNNIIYPIKHDEGTAYQHHGTGFEQLKHQPVNSAQIFQNDAYKDKTNPQPYLKTSLINPSTTINSSSDPRIYKNDSAPQYDPSQQATLQNKTKFRFSEINNIKENDLKEQENKFYGESLKNALNLRKIDIERFKEKETLFPTTTNQETNTYRANPANLNLNVYDTSAKLTSQFQKAFLNHPNGDQRTPAVDYTDITAITPFVGGEDMKYTINGKPNKHLRNSSTLLSIDDSVRSAERSDPNKIPYQNPMSVGPVWRTIHGGMELGYTELPEKKCTENGSQQDPTKGEAPYKKFHKVIAVDVREKNTPSAERQVISQIVGEANDNVLAEQMTKGTLDNFPRIGVLVPEHRKDYMAPIEVDTIKFKQLKAKSKHEVKKFLKEKIQKQK